MPRLFEIADALEVLIARAVDPETGELAPEFEQQLTDLELERDEKALAVAAYLKGEESEADAIAAESKRLADRARVHRNRADRLRYYLASNLPIGTKLEDARSALSWRKTTAVDVTCTPEELPQRYQRWKCEADKAALADALKAGEEIKGAGLVTRHSLVIR